METVLDFPDGPQVITRVLKQRRGRQKRSREEHCGEDSGRCCWLLTREEVAMNRGYKQLWEAGEDKKMTALLELPEGPQPHQLLTLDQCDAFQRSTSRTARKYI